MFEWEAQKKKQKTKYQKVFVLVKIKGEPKKHVLEKCVKSKNNWKLKTNEIQSLTEAIAKG